MRTVKGKVFTVDAMRTWGVEAYLQLFLKSAFDGGEWLASRTGRCTPEERASEYEAG
jgi:hypothetical protein